MSETRRRKGKGAQAETQEGPSKMDYEIAKYLRNKCPKKQTKFFDDKVHYFTGSKAVDSLMDSKWAKGTKKVDQLFKDRGACVDYLDKLLRLHLFIRGEKFDVVKVEKKSGKDNKSKGKKNEAEAQSDGKDKNEKESAKDKKEKVKAGKDEKSDEASDDEPESPKTEAKDSEKKKKRKIRLETHADQVFLDSNDAYVWMYEPTSVKNIAIGAVIVLGSIGACLFPLWPPIVRQGVYYLSLVMIGLLGLLISVALFRYVVFGIVWAFTGGKYTFWYLPNLTEDCGFFDSFKPSYTLAKKGDEDKSKKTKKSKKSEKEEENDGDDTAVAEGNKSDPETKKEKPLKSPPKKGRKDSDDLEEASESQKSRNPKLSPQVSLGDKESDNVSTASEDAFEVINAGPETDS